MSNSVLCAIDLSNGGHDVGVLRQAARLAELDNAQLDVVTVLPDYGDAWVSTFFEQHHHQEAVANAEAKLREVCVEVLGEDRNAAVRHVVATGTAYQEILKTAEVAGSDLIVIGAHKPDMIDRIQGPNSSRVARHAKCSVFIVRD